MIVIIAIATTTFACTFLALQRIATSVSPLTATNQAAYAQIATALVCMTGMFIDPEQWLPLALVAAVGYLVLLGLMISSWRSIG